MDSVSQYLCINNISSIRIAHEREARRNSFTSIFLEKYPPLSGILDWAWASDAWNTTIVVWCVLNAFVLKVDKLETVERSQYPGYCWSTLLVGNSPCRFSWESLLQWRDSKTLERLNSRVTCVMLCGRCPLREDFASNGPHVFESLKCVND